MEFTKKGARNVPSAVPDWINQLGLADMRPPVFFRSIEEIDRLRPAHPQAHTMRRAWEDMSLDGILCFDNAPVAYFRSGHRFEDATIRTLHAQVWNQGIAPLLVVITDKRVCVYSSLALPAKAAEQMDDQGRLVQVLDRTLDAIAVQYLVRRIELGDVFREHSRCFDPKRRVDRHLLNHLTYARTILGNVTPRVGAATIHALLGRVIFICYLVDREIISRDYFARCGAAGCAALLDLLAKYPPRQAKDLLYALFGRLKETFNGDLFDANLEEEASRVDPAHVDVLRRFLADEVPGGQLSLGFTTYDFRFIPIETISAIYERFLDAEDADVRRETGAYYTPRFLAEIVLDSAMEGTGSLLDRRFLDPSCGSGIFLVGIFNRLAEEWRARHPGAENLARAEALTELLTGNIFGVDLSETACHIAALSLYLALLDQLLPRDIQKLQETKRGFLPKLVASGSDGNGDGDAGQGRNIFRSDFFDPSLTLPAEGFDFIVGNPPWARATGPESAAEAWCDAQDLPIAQRQLAYAFLWKAPTHVRGDGRICLVVPAATLFNHQDRALRFQERFFASHQIDSVLNLSDLVFYLFDGADRPAVVLRYRGHRPPRPAYVPYAVPKTDYETLRAEVLSIGGADCTEFRLSELLRELKANEPPVAWKEAMWATSRGRKFLDRLREYPPLSDRLRNDDGTGGDWEFGEGFNTGGKGKPVDRPILHKLPFLPSSAVGHYVVSPQRLRPRPPVYNPRYMGKEDIFSAPHVLFPHGVPRTGERLRVTYCPFACSFEHSIRGINAPTRDENDLRFLTCALSSPLALYFFFHTAANWGTERAKIHVAEYGRFPFPLADTPERREALREAAEIHRRLEAEQDVNPLFLAYVEERRELIDNVVYAYYEIDAAERLLIEDTVNVWIPSATPRRGARRIPTLEPSSATQRDRYARILVQTLGSWMTRRGKGLSYKVLLSTTTSLGVTWLQLRDNTLAKQIEAEQASSAALDKVLKRIHEVLPERYGSLRHMRDLKVFDGPDLYAIKPLAARYWTDTAALNDADEIMTAILRFLDGRE